MFFKPNHYGLELEYDLSISVPLVKVNCLWLPTLMQALIADFELSEGIYSRAKIEDTDSVCLWLGANVMLEYSCDEVIFTSLSSLPL